MTWEIHTSGAAIAKAGLYANSTIVASGAYLAQLYDEALSLVSNIARVDLSGGYAGYSYAKKKIIQDVMTAYIAQQVISYDMSGYTSRGEAIQILNVLENNIRRNLDLLKDDKYKTFIGAT